MLFKRSAKPDREPRRFTARALLAAAVLAGAIAGPISAHASNQFNDVADDHPFHAEIDWLTGTGITEGYADGGFHPGTAVTRQAMAAFFQRYFTMTEGLTATTSSTNTSSTTATSWQDLPGAVLQVEIPEGTTGRIDTRFNAESVCTGPALRWCQVRILVDGAPVNPWADRAFDGTDSGTATSYSWESHSVENVSSTLASGPHEVMVQYRASGFGFTEGTATLDDWTMVADVILNDVVLAP